MTGPGFEETIFACLQYTVPSYFHSQGTHDNAASPFPVGKEQANRLKSGLAMGPASEAASYLAPADVSKAREALLPPLVVPLKAIASKAAEQPGCARGRAETVSDAASKGL